MMTEKEAALKLAERILDRIYDPDDDLSILARQLLRTADATTAKAAQIGRLEEELKDEQQRTQHYLQAAERAEAEQRIDELTAKLIDADALHLADEQSLRNVTHALAMAEQREARLRALVGDMIRALRSWQTSCGDYNATTDLMVRARALLADPDAQDQKGDRDETATTRDGGMPSMPTGAKRIRRDDHRSDVQGVRETSGIDHAPAREEWRVVLTCCGRDAGSGTFSTWAAADAFRQSYTSGYGVDQHGYGDCACGEALHRRSGVIEAVETPSSPSSEPEE